MDMDENASAHAELIGRVLIRAFALGMGLLMIWFVFLLVGKDFAFRIHTALFGITEQQFMLINYAGMGLLKIFAFAVFLVPYIAIRWAMAGKAKG